MFKSYLWNCYSRITCSPQPLVRQEEYIIINVIRAILQDEEVSLEISFNCKLLYKGVGKL
jgi:hypothetical protein